MTNNKKQSISPILAVLLALMLTIIAVSCVDPTDGGGGGGGSDPVEPVGIEGTWVYQKTSAPALFVVLEFTSDQLNISGTDSAAYSYTDTDGEIKIGTSSGSLDQTFCDSYDITADVLTFSGGTSGDDYPSANFYRANALTANVWKDGAITSDSQGQVWYSFNVTDGTTYRMWWNDSDSGNGLKLMDVYVYAYYSNGTSISFAGNDAGWTTARYFTPNASQAGAVYVRVTPYNANGTGTFGVVYTIGGTGAVAERPNVPFNPPSPISLTAGVWADGEITTDSNGEVWYSLSIANLTAYNFWWNENGNNGNGMKTLDVSVRGFYSNGDTISSFSTTATAWSSAKVFSPTNNDTLYLRVTPAAFGNTGTFGIVYNTSIGTARPPADFNPSATPLTADTWKDGEIIGTGSAGLVWYSLTVTGGTPYYFWWNEVELGSVYTPVYGNRTKTLNIKVSAFDSSGMGISTFANTDSAWGTVKSYTPTASGTLYLRVEPNTSNNTGTYGIVYSETSSRPSVPIDAVNPIALTANEWKRGEITGGSSGEVWYSIDVISGTNYRIWWNDSYSGNGLFRTLDVRASAWGSNGESIPGFYDTDSGWSSAQSYAPTVNGTVYIKVYPKTAGAVGTFDIVYNTTGTRPPVPFISPEPPNPIPLTAGVWKDGEITTVGGEAWYSINVTAGTTYYVWANGFNYGNGLKSLGISMSAWYSNGTSISTSNNGWSTPYQFTPTENGTVYFRVTPFNSGNTGTFGIVYNTTNTRPSVPFTPPVNPTPLTAGTWANGEINAASNGEAWYSFTVASGTQYRIWLNDFSTYSSAGYTGNDTKTLNIYLSAFYSDGTEVFDRAIDYAWDNGGEYFTPTAGQAGTVYIKVYPYTSGNTGTFGVVYNTGTTRPIIPFTPPASHIALTDGVWTNGAITGSSGSEVWYSLSVTSGTRYQIWWNDSGSGDRSKTLNIKASALYSSGAEIFIGEDDGWGSSSGASTLTCFSAGSTGTVYIKVYPKTAGATGTFGIAYNTAYAARPPVSITPVSPTALTDGVWTDGAITTAGGEAWYSFSVTNNTRYYVWWNDSANGDNTKTLDVTGSGYYAGGALVDDNFTFADNAWGTAQAFTVSQTGTVYIRISPKNPSSTGTFGVIYSTTNTRPVP